MDEVRRRGGASLSEGAGLLRVTPASGIRGSVRVPPDKSISHRAAMLGAIASGTTEIDDYLVSLDTLATLECLRAFGVEVGGPGPDGRVTVKGRPLDGTGTGGFAEPETVLDAGNSGTTLRLLLGLAAAHPIFWVITGDESLRRRPMKRVAEPLTRMGARIWMRQAGCAPVAVRGGALSGTTWRSEVASAQVKSAVLLAGLQAKGVTRFEEPWPSRDHTERLLAYFGVPVRHGPGWAEVQGPQQLQARHVRVPGDPSSAAFFWAAAAMHPGSVVHTPGVGLNPTRIEVLKVLAEMGAEVEIRPGPAAGPEPWGDVTVRGPEHLKAFELRGARIALLIDELPVLAVAATRAEGVSLITDAAELRVKESDRIEALCSGLAALGVDVEALPDGMRIAGPQRVRGGVADSRGDHRVAMALAVGALAGSAPSVVKGSRCIEISFPEFATALGGLARAGGGKVEEVREG